MNDSIIKKYFVYSTDELKKVNYFWWGIILYFAAHTLTASNQVNFTFFQLFMILGIFMFSYYGFILAKFKFDGEYQKILFVLLIFWSTVTVLRGLKINKDDIIQLFFSPWFGMLPYYVPLVMLFSKKLILYRKAFSVTVIFSVLYLLYSFMFYSHLTDPDPENVISRTMVEYFSRDLSVTVGFLLLIYSYNSNRKLFFTVLVILITIYFALVRARRGLLMMNVGIFIFWYIIYFMQVKRKTVIVVVSFIVFFAGFSLFVYLYNIGIFERYFEIIASRGIEDTRSNVENYFYSDMKVIDWIIGRGMDGEYYYPFDGGSTRNIMETDYLHIVLKGGIIYLALILGLLIPAIFKGLFQSKNLLAKACAFWILFWMLNLYPSTVRAFNMTYIFVWLGAGICYSRELRNIPDRALAVFFRLPRLFWIRKHPN